LWSRRPIFIRFDAISVPRSSARFANVAESMLVADRGFSSECYNNAIIKNARGQCSRVWTMITKDVTHVSFSALTDAEIIAMSVCEVTKPSLVFTQDKASLGTLFDPRMGSTSALDRCVTCGSAIDKCNGHSGHHHIALPMPHPLHLDPLFRALRSSCYFCYAACAGGCCPDCGRKQGKWHRDAVGRPLGQRTRYFHKHNLLTQRMVFFTPLEARAFIAKRPECRAMFIHTLCVLPPCARPSRRSPAGWTHAPLSRAYAAVVKESNNLTLFVSECLVRHVVLAQATRLAHALGQLFDTSKCKDERSQGLRQRLDGKQGRFRQNLLGTYQLSPLRLPSQRNPTSSCICCTVSHAPSPSCDRGPHERV